MPDDTRRAILGSLGGGLIGLAGCSRDEGGETGGPQDDGQTDRTPTASDTPASSGTDSAPTAGTGGTATDAGTDSLDRREANVVDVVVDTAGDGTYRFDVTLHHDDDGEDGYANWWQVETVDGQKLGRRDLLHPHSEQPFTRSETIEIPDDVDCVVVRGHDETHGYGGQAMLVTLATGETAPIQQGTERDDASEATCPEDA